MEIRSKKELRFFIMADRMMNRGSFRPSVKDFIKDVIKPDYLMRFLVIMRKVSYYSQKKGGGILPYYYKWRFSELSLKLGFSIGYNCFDYGLVIPHYGTIVVGSSNRFGKYAVLHTSTCITDNGKIVGDAFYLSTGVKITSRVDLGDNISVGSNSLVNKSYLQGNVLLAGTPAKVIKPSDPWYIRDGEQYSQRVENVEELRKRMF